MQQRITFTLIYGAIFMLAPFAIDMYLPALPTIATDLHTGIDQLEGSVAILLFGYAIGQLIIGPISDRLGRVNIMVWGLVTFTIATLLAGFVVTIEQLYLARLFQAFGGAAATVVIFPMIRDRNNEQGAAKTISYVMAITVIAPLIAPIIASFILTKINWSWIFFALAIFAALVTICAKYWIKPASSSSIRKSEFSFSAITVSFGKILRNKQIMFHILAGSFAFAGLFAFVAGSPYVYITYYGIAAENYGYLVGLNAVAMIGVNLVNAKLLDAVNPTKKLIVGVVLMCIIGFILVIISALNLGIYWLVAGIVAYIGALGLTATNAIVGALSVLPEENGTVSALNGSLQFGIGAVSSLAISILSSTDATLLTSAMFISAIFALIAGLQLRTKQKGALNA